MKANKEIAVGIILSLIPIGILLSIIIMDLLDIGYWYEFPYLVFVGLTTLGLILLSVGGMGLLTKNNHKSGIHICLVVGAITTIASFLIYYIWW